MRVVVRRAVYRSVIILCRPPTGQADRGDRRSGGSVRFLVNKGSRRISPGVALQRAAFAGSPPGFAKPNGRAGRHHVGANPHADTGSHTWA